MINYWPIILDSTQSETAIWLDIRSAFIELGEEYLTLHIACTTGTLTPGKWGDGFYDGSEEGYDQTIFRCPVSKAVLKKMVVDVTSKLAEVYDNTVPFNFQFSSLYQNKPQILIQISRQET
jgi:hypothetical protein